MIRAVLDTNVIVSGVIHPAGTPGRLLAALLEE
jgi:predicted nucleic acid-binding protein